MMKIKPTKLYIPEHYYEVSKTYLITSEVLRQFSKKLTESSKRGAHAELATITMELSNMFKFKFEQHKSQKSADHNAECVRQILINLSKQLRGKRKLKKLSKIEEEQSVE
jgi:hypothetical protein